MCTYYTHLTPDALPPTRHYTAPDTWCSPPPATSHEKLTIDPASLPFLSFNVPMLSAIRHPSPIIASHIYIIHNLTHSIVIIVPCTACTHRVYRVPCTRVRLLLLACKAYGLCYVVTLPAYKSPVLLIFSYSSYCLMLIKKLILLILMYYNLKIYNIIVTIYTSIM